MKAWHRVAVSALLALAAMSVTSAQASVTYVFMPSTLTQTSGIYGQVPVPFVGPIGQMTISDAAFAKRKIDSYLDVEAFFFDVPSTYATKLPITHLTPCQLPTITGSCSYFASTIAMTLSEDGAIESGGITYYGGYWHLPDFSWFDNDRILTMSGSDGDWSGRQVGETGICNTNPGCLFTGQWVPIPEPATAWLLGAGFGLAFWLRRRQAAIKSQS